jgi:hypothetical protein
MIAEAVMPTAPSNPAEGTSSSSSPRSAARSRRTRAAAVNGIGNGGRGVPERSVSGDKKTMRKTRRTLPSIALPFFALLLLVLGTQRKTYLIQVKTIGKETSAKIPQQQQQHRQATASHEEAKSQALSLSNHKYPHSKNEFPGRQRPRDKVIYLLHIHKSGGTALCNMARFNLLSTSMYNCNVQPDQRCCGNQDSLERQTAYANRTKYDFVASEGRMYESMDPNSYSYIIVLRKSLQRYYSHWKAAKQTYRLLPPSMRLEDEPELVAAGGAQGVGHHIQPAPVNQQVEEDYAQMMDLVRESKQQRAKRREQKMLEIAEWKRNVQKEVEEAQRQPSVQQQQQQQQEQSNGDPPPPPKPLTIKDFTEDANNNRAFFLPHRRLLDDRPLDRSQEQSASSSQLIVNLERQASDAPPFMFPHPAQDRAFRTSGSRMPIFGRTFAEWWQAQPDNWNFRQLCGTHCQGIPKYQLTMNDWAHTLSRLLQFDTVLFLEAFQSSIQVLATRHDWNQSSIDAMMTSEERQAIANQRQLKLATEKNVERLSQVLDKNSREYKELIEEAAKLPSASTDAEWHEWYRQAKAKEKGKNGDQIPEEEPRFKERQLRHWDPLMSALDDALYDIAQRWEVLKQQRAAPTTLTSQELSSLANVYNLSPEAQDIFQFYMEAEGEHRTLCQNECCAEICSAW